MLQKNYIIKTSLLFLLAGFCEILGGYLVWVWIRNDWGILFGILGGITLFLYGIIPTLQPVHFHRAYAAYGGIFIIMSIMWGFFLEGISPDIFDLLGGAIAIIGAAIIFYSPRRENGR